MFEKIQTGRRMDTDTIARLFVARGTKKYRFVTWEDTRCATNISWNDLEVAKESVSRNRNDSISGMTVLQTYKIN